MDARIGPQERALDVSQQRLEYPPPPDAARARGGAAVRAADRGDRVAARQQRARNPARSHPVLDAHADERGRYDPEQADRGGADAGDLAGAGGRRSRGVPPGGRCARCRACPAAGSCWRTRAASSSSTWRRAPPSRCRAGSRPEWQLQRRAFETGQVQISGVFTGAYLKSPSGHRRAAGAAARTSRRSKSSSACSPASS